MDEKLNDSDEINPRYIADQVQLIKEKISKYNRKYTLNENLLILIGCTGAGKTTLAYLLSGEQLECVDSDAGFVLQPKFKSIDGLGDIGHECVSKTYIPGFAQQNRIRIIDNAGIGDNRGINLRIINSLITEELLPKCECRLRVLIVMASSEVQARKANVAKTILEAVESFIAEDLWESTLGIVFTKIDKSKGQRADRFINYMKRGDYKGNLLMFFSTHPSNVFELPSPDKLGIYNPSNLLFDKLIQFSKNAPISKPECRGLLIDGQTFKDLFNAWSKLAQNYKEHVSSLLKEINDLVLESVENIWSINRYKTFLNDLKESIAIGMGSFQATLKKRQNIYLSPKVRETLNVVEMFVPLNDFFENFQRFSPDFELFKVKSPAIDYKKWTYDFLNSQIKHIDYYLKTAQQIKDLEQQQNEGLICQQQLKMRLQSQRRDLDNIRRQSEADIIEKNKQIERLKKESNEQIAALTQKIYSLKNNPPKVITRIIEKPVHITIYRTVEKSSSGCYIF